MHNNHLVAFSLFFPFHSLQLLHFTGGHNWPQQSNMNAFRWHLIINLLDESGLCLSPVCSSEKKMSEACSRWSCPLEVSLFPVIERVGSYSPDWVLGSVQAAAVNEPRCSLLCHAAAAGSPYTSPRFYMLLYLHGSPAAASGCPLYCAAQTLQPNCVYIQRRPSADCI